MAEANGLVTTERRGDELVISIGATVIESTNCLALRKAIDAALRSRPSDITRVRLEPRNLTAMSSAGFEALLLLHRTCKEAGLALLVGKPTSEFGTLLARMGFLRLLKVDGAGS
ncbi:MAG: STAS domain-containing protein [Phycisphaerales bacterium]|nr:STAS domain-containing protein [Phycisphaerales bacterium]